MDKYVELLVRILGSRLGNRVGSDGGWWGWRGATVMLSLVGTQRRKENNRMERKQKKTICLFCICFNSSGHS